MGFDDVAVGTVGKNYYRIYFWYMSKAEDVTRMTNADLREKRRQL